MNPRSYKLKGIWLLIAFLALTAVVYWPGLSGGWLFDDYPNIVDNYGVQPKHADVATLVNAALSSPSSEFKRPLASLSFALNYLASGLDPYWMKLTNLVIHLLNGMLVFLLSKALLERARALVGGASAAKDVSMPPLANIKVDGKPFFAAEAAPTGESDRVGIVAALIAAGWMLLPINLTGVLYVVQRMESMANLFVLLGLLGYVSGRRRMLAIHHVAHAPERTDKRSRGFGLCIASLILCTSVGILAKETAVMLPLYAFLIEWLLFGFRQRAELATKQIDLPDARPTVQVASRRDRRVMGLFVLLLFIPMLLGLAWLLPGVLNPATWATRDFTLGTRLLSEARIVSDYVVWTLLPTPSPLSFYHDNFVISTGLLTPWTTLAGIVFLACLVGLVWWLRRRQPLVALGIALFLGCQLLTGTILPLELIYEHRNYFASFGLLLAVVPLLAAPSRASMGAVSTIAGAASATTAVSTMPLASVDTDDKPFVAAKAAPTVVAPFGALPMALPRYVLLAGLMLCWATLTAMTAYAWGNPLRLAQDLASRAPDSPRAQYELGRTYIIYSHYDPASPFTHLAYAPLEKSAALPDSSILPEQALIFMNSRMHLPLKDAWWNSMVAKLKAHKPGVQDESSLGALTKCAENHQCDLPQARMTSAYLAALSHPYPSARLLAMYGDYAWNVLEDHALGLRMTRAAVHASPNEPAYQITLVRMLVVQGDLDKARKVLAQMQTLNIGGRLDGSLKELHHLPGMAR